MVAWSICARAIGEVHSDNEIEANKALPVMKEAERYSLLDHVSRVLPCYIRPEYGKSWKIIQPFPFFFVRTSLDL